MLRSILTELANVQQW